jgi:hypothetical protein
MARLGHGLIAAAIAVTASCAAPQASPDGAAGALPVGPRAGDMELSSFYRWTDAEPPQPGAMLRREALALQAEMPAAAEAFRILYGATDTRWRSGPIEVSGVMFIPRGEAPAGGWPLLSWAHGTLGIADRCAPSWTGLRARDATYLNRWLAAGFAVVATDYQGLGGPGPHPYLDWRAEGTSVLDAARAVVSAEAGRVANQVFVAGQSQGSGAALGAAMLANDYAPGLNVRGAVITGFNRNFPDGPVTIPPRISSNIFLSYASGGLRDDAPAIDTLVNHAGAAVLAATREGCSAEIGREARRLGIEDLGSAFAISMDQLAAMTLPVTDMPFQAAGRPLFFGTGLADETTTPTLQHAGVSAMCAAGDAVTWRRYDRLGHDGALLGSLDDSVAFARTLLNGAAPPSDCARLTPPGPMQERDPNAPFNDD